jgi:alpha-tubulin suppressor-like RCC1 family protein
MSAHPNAKLKSAAAAILLQAATSFALLSACGAPDDAPSSPVTGDAGADGAEPTEDASSDDTDATIGDAAVDRRPPGDAEAEVPSIVHDVWAGTQVTCARVEMAGSITTRCWGNNRGGQLGRGEIAAANGEAFSPQPIQSPIAPDIVQISVGQPTCARTSDAVLRCWGRSYDSSAPVSTPPNEPLLAGVDDVGASGTYSCVRRSNGHVACWGRNYNGELGLGYKDSAVHPTPEEIPDFTVDRISVGQSHACAVKEGNVWCWGSNSNGALGELVPKYSNSLAPGRVPNVSGITQVVAGLTYTCALGSDTTVWCWGDIPQASSSWVGAPIHMLEVGFDDNDPDPDRLLTGVVEISGGQSVCARMTSGAVKCIGTSGDMVGYPDPAHFRQSRRFTTVLGINDATRIAAGFDHVCALTQAGVLRCWGDNSQGQLGIDPLVKGRSGLPERVRF